MSMPVTISIKIDDMENKQKIEISSVHDNNYYVAEFFKKLGLILNKSASYEDVYDELSPYLTVNKNVVTITALKTEHKV